MGLEPGSADYKSDTLSVVLKNHIWIWIDEGDTCHTTDKGLLKISYYVLHQNMVRKWIKLIVRFFRGGFFLSKITILQYFFLIKCCTLPILSSGHGKMAFYRHSWNKMSYARMIATTLKNRTNVVLKANNTTEKVRLHFQCRCPSSSWHMGRTIINNQIS